MCLSLAGRVVEVDAEGREALVDVDGRARPVSLAVLTLEGTAVTPGTWLLVHTGFAVEVLDDDAAREMAAYHRQVRAASKADTEEE